MIIPTVKIPADNARGYKIVNADDPRANAPAGDEITREGIDKMPKAEVAELLEAHGAPAAGKVADMRARLKTIMFLEG